MRLPSELSGKINNHAKQRGFSDSEAHIDILESGCTALGLSHSFQDFRTIPVKDLTTFDLFGGIARVNSVADYLSIVNSLHTDPSNPGADPLSFYYRGQPGPYPLLPKLLRPGISKHLISAHETILGRSKMSLNDVQKEMIFRLARYAE